MFSWVPGLMNYRFAVVSTVDTGGPSPSPELVEVGVVPVNAGTVRSPVRTWLVKPSAPLGVRAFGLSGLRNVDVADAPPIEEVSGEIRRALAGRVVVAHRVTGRCALLAAGLPDWAPAHVVDTESLARLAWPSEPGLTLGALAARLGVVVPGRWGRAGLEATVSAAVFLRLVALLNGSRSVPVPRMIAEAISVRLPDLGGYSADTSGIPGE